MSNIHSPGAGSKPKSTPEQKQIAQLEKEKVKLKKQLQLKNETFALQKKSLGYTRNPAERERRIMMVLETRETHLALSQCCVALNVSRSTVNSRLRSRAEIKKT